MIVGHGIQKITDGDTILTYGASAVIESMLKQAHNGGKKFKVIVVDARPKLEGSKKYIYVNVLHKTFLNKLAVYCVAINDALYDKLFITLPASKGIDPFYLDK